MRIVVALALLVAGPALAGLDLTAPEPYAVGQTTVTFTKNSETTGQPRPLAAAPLVTLAMGPVGAISRLALRAAGSLVTFESVGAPTAPGQLPLAELAPLVRRFFPAAA